MWFVYLVQCRDGTLYCGIAKDVAARVAKHNAGKGSKYTKGRRPVKLVAMSGPLKDRSTASLYEYMAKHLREKGQAAKVNYITKIYDRKGWTG